MRHFSIQTSRRQLQWKVKKERFCECQSAGGLLSYPFMFRSWMPGVPMKGQDHVQGFPICGTWVNYCSYTPIWILWCWLNCDLFRGCSLHGEHSEGFAFPLGHTFHWTCVLSDRAEGSQWIQNFQRRDLEGQRGTPTRTQHKCLSLISSESSERKLSWKHKPPKRDLQALASHQSCAWNTPSSVSRVMALFFPICLAHPRDRAEIGTALPPACFFFFFHYVSNQFSLLCSCSRVGKGPSWWEIRGSLACTQSLFSPKH